jgi:hypothetical protein
MSDVMAYLQWGATQNLLGEWVPSGVAKKCVGIDLDTNHWGCIAWRCPLWRRERPAALSWTVRDMGAGAVPSLCRTRRSALWPGWSKMVQGRLPPRWNLDLTPGREIL